MALRSRHENFDVGTSVKKHKKGRRADVAVEIQTKTMTITILATEELGQKIATNLEKLVERFPELIEHFKNGFDPGAVFFPKPVVSKN